jgi:hypothetical protein
LYSTQYEPRTAVCRPASLARTIADGVVRSLSTAVDVSTCSTGVDAVGVPTPLVSEPAPQPAAASEPASAQAENEPHAHRDAQGRRRVP